jgi:hypothetical protein
MDKYIYKLIIKYLNYSNNIVTYKIKFTTRYIYNDTQYWRYYNDYAVKYENNSGRLEIGYKEYKYHWKIKKNLHCWVIDHY